ncbi:hypothetical protein [Virgibacillus sp. SK37]|uniref:hypothetical protein n=1 Tax=Virgibacillus sp. SK37 TaxID=403957 RepID=UPI0004D1343E|nr:hypothetical protein [Virgibacillus sp. SK37]AIF45663.1 hypothetical protein X953_18920 [Virgibacillus sp. SK37]
MNLIDYEVVEVLNVKPCTEEWVKEFEEEILEIELIANAVGRNEYRKIIKSKEDWKKIEKQGFFLS